MSLCYVCDCYPCACGNEQYDEEETPRVIKPEHLVWPDEEYTS